MLHTPKPKASEFLEASIATFREHGWRQGATTHALDMLRELESGSDYFGCPGMTWDKESATMATLNYILENWE